MVSWLLPRHLHQHFYNLYAYCRWADDLGDEISDPAKALELLDDWDRNSAIAMRASRRILYLSRCGKRLPRCDIPIEPFSDLLIAFRQDQTVHRYATWDDVLDYCRYSANPVGRLVLYLCGYRDAERQQLSDATCTALQLANFWQDVARDLEKGRIYIPLEALAAHGLTEDDIVPRRFDARYVSLMKELIARTRELFAEGHAAGAQRRFRAARGHRNVQPRRACSAGFHRSDWIQHAGAQAVDCEIEAACDCWCARSVCACFRSRNLPRPLRRLLRPIPGRLPLWRAAALRQTFV